MAANRKRLELFFFGLYFGAILIGTSMDAIAQIVTR